MCFLSSALPLHQGLQDQLLPLQEGWSQVLKAVRVSRPPLSFLCIFLILLFTSTSCHPTQMHQTWCLSEREAWINDPCLRGRCWGLLERSRPFTCLGRRRMNFLISLETIHSQAGRHRGLRNSSEKELGQSEGPEEALFGHCVCPEGHARGVMNKHKVEPFFRPKSKCPAARKKDGNEKSEADKTSGMISASREHQARTLGSNRAPRKTKEKQPGMKNTYHQTRDESSPTKVFSRKCRVSEEARQKPVQENLSLGHPIPAILKEKGQKGCPFAKRLAEKIYSKSNFFS